MTKKGLTGIITILDRSGSMGGLQSAVIEAYNSFITEQKAVEGEAWITLTQFDDRFQTDYSGVDIQDVAPLSFETYQPRGLTALYDAIGKTINSEGQKLAKLPERERPEKIIVVIYTDGYENASKEFDNAKVKSMVEHQKNKYGWDFLFLGAGIDAAASGAFIGIPKQQTMSFQHSAAGYMASGVSVSATVTGTRTTGDAPVFSQ